MSLMAWYDRGMKNIEDLMTTREAAEFLGIQPATVRQHIANGNLPGAFKKGRDWFIPAIEVEAIKDVKPGRRPKKPS